MINKLKFVQFGVSQEKYKVVILIKEESLSKDELIKHYLDPMIKINPSLQHEDFIAINIDYGGSKTAKVNATIKPWLTFLANYIQCDLIMCTDTAYFKVLTTTRNVTHSYGSVVQCTFEGYTTIQCVLNPSYKTLFYDSKNQSKIDLSNGAVAANFGGKALFEQVIHSAQYPVRESEIKEFLDSLHQYSALSCDIEAYSLNHTKAKLGTIGFAWDKHNGGAFAVDNSKESRNLRIRELLKKFFIKFLVTDEKKLLWHNVSYDVKVLIWELMMESLHINKVEMLIGLEMFVNSGSFECTKIIAYLATNSCDGNELGLKTLALPFAGNYGLDDDIKDITKIPTPKLLEYNLVDCLSTWYVHDTYYPILVADNQLRVYEEIFKPSVTVLMQAELHGMPINMNKVYKAEKVLAGIVNSCSDRINKNQYIIDFMEFQRCKNYHELHAKWKKKTAPLSDPAFDCEFNMNSPNQLVELLYNMLELPVIDLTDTKLPAAGGKTLKKLKSHTTDPKILEILDIIIEFNGAIKILTSFIPAFKDAYYCASTGQYYLSGNFNLGGTVSGRLSCSNPNLQQIPSGSVYAKLIKDCFEAPEGWLMVGLDFNSLEDYISALTTKDPNKLKVYTDLYDGHCLRAYKYFKDEMPDIEDTVESINSIKKLYGKVRDKSKAPTFALTYQGTYKTLMNNCGFSEEVAIGIEDNFKELYCVSIQYIKDKLNEASKTGYVEVAFGMKVRTPIIKKSLWDSLYTPYEAAAEGRTAGNALGQGYGMLNNRAAIDFQKRTLVSAYRLMIWPIAHIHDAQYFMVKDNLDLLCWMNRELVDCVTWQELPELKHDTVKIGGDLSVFYPSWKNEIVIPNGMFDKKILHRHLYDEHQKYLADLEK